MYERDFIARFNDIVGANPGSDQGRDDHNETERDDCSQGEHGSKHPFPMLVNLQALDVVPCKCHAHRADNDKHAHGGLCFNTPSKRATADHQGARVGNQDEQDDRVAIHTMEEEKLMTDKGDELEDHEKASRKNGAEVQRYPYPIVIFTVPIPFARRGAISKAARSRAADVDI